MGTQNTPPSDATFHAESAYGSALWVATVFGRSASWLRDHREELDVEGFPPPDPITGYWIKADVRTWIDRRRRLPDASATRSERVTQSGARLNAF